jgi:hypothetical protein
MRFLTVSELVRVRRWKREAIVRLLGKPDRIVPGAHKQPAHLYVEYRVLLAEQQYKPFRSTRRGKPGRDIVAEMCASVIRVERIG